MRSLWVALGGLCVVACGDDFSNLPQGDPGHAGRGGSSGAHDSAATAGVSGLGDTAGVAGKSGSGGAAIAGMAGNPDVGDAGSPSAGADDGSSGQGGEAPTHNDAGAPGDAGAGAVHSTGGSGGKPTDSCNCDAKHTCVKGACVLNPECDCQALGVECSSLHAALGEAYSCPVEVQCGSCEAGKLCVVPYSELDDLSFERKCITPDVTTPPQGCAVASGVDPAYGDSALCPYSLDCSVPYGFCYDVAGIVNINPDAKGSSCPAAVTAEFTFPD